MVAEERSTQSLSWRTVPAGAGGFVLVGAVAIVAGGFVSAAVAARPTAHEAWAAAYLVLVVGVAQLLLGGMQSALSGPLGRARLRGELVGWSLGSMAVLVGVLTRSTAVVDVASAALLVVLGYFAAGSGRTTKREPTALAWCYRLLLVLLGVSIVTGVFLARSLPG